MLHAHVKSFLKTLFLMFLFVKLTRFWPSKSMFMFINAEMTPYKHETSERAKIRVIFLFDCVCHVYCVSAQRLISIVT